jgi:hypothetical protein
MSGDKSSSIKVTPEISALCRIFSNRVNTIVHEIFESSEFPFDSDDLTKIIRPFDFSLVAEPEKRVSKSKSDTKSEKPATKSRAKSTKSNGKPAKQRFFNITSDCRHAFAWILNEVVEFTGREAFETMNDINNFINTEISEFDEYSDSHAAPMDSIVVAISYWYSGINEEAEKDAEALLVKNEEDEEDNNKKREFYTKLKTRALLRENINTAYAKMGISEKRRNNYFTKITLRFFEELIYLVARQTAQSNIRSRRYVLSDQLFENILSNMLPTMGVMELAKYMNNRPKKTVAKKSKVTAKPKADEESDEEIIDEVEEFRKQRDAAKVKNSKTSAAAARDDDAEADDDAEETGRDEDLNLLENSDEDDEEPEPVVKTRILTKAQSSTDTSVNKAKGINTKTTSLQAMPTMQRSAAPAQLPRYATGDTSGDENPAPIEPVVLNLGQHDEIHNSDSDREINESDANDDSDGMI